MQQAGKRTNGDWVAFAGSKLALFLGGDLLVIQRDNIPTIPYPDCWDFPGGMAEPGESPQDCVIRETYEEVSLSLKQSDLVTVQVYDRPIGRVWFFAAHLPASKVNDVELGDEGQGWQLMSPQTFATHPKAVPHFGQWVMEYCASDLFAG